MELRELIEEQRMRLGNLYHNTDGLLPYYTYGNEEFVYKMGRESETAHRTEFSWG